ncbi:MAG TPA: FkbM family methyltransferase [Bryobacteraceae bacterium]|nr:FkbM family methyltransferase [Bryobacteraceae bacterium]
MDAATFIYTVLLKPKPLRHLATKILLKLIPERLQVGSAVVMLNPRDPVVSGALTLGLYEKAETLFFNAACRPGMMFLDIGANAGYYTALALAAGARVIALEPDPECFHYLSKTIAANSGDARPFQRAAGSAPGKFTLYRSGDNRGDNRLYPHPFSTSEEVVEVCTVDDLLAEIGQTTIDFIKMDVQGFEGHAIAGMQQTLRRSPNVVMMTEFWPMGLERAGSDPLAVLQGLEALGFALWHLTPKGLTVPITDKVAFIAAHPDRNYTNIVVRRPEAR